MSTAGLIKDTHAQYTARIAEIDQQIAPLLAERANLVAVVRTIERQQTPSSRRTGARPSGGNNDRILAAIGDSPATTAEICERTGIGRGSADRTLKKLAQDGAVRKTTNGWEKA